MSDVQILERVPSATPGMGAVMRSPMHRQHVAVGCRFIREAGWELPAAYQAVEAERDRTRTGLVIADITARSKADVRGAIDAVRTSVPVPHGAAFHRVSPTWALVLGPPGALQNWIPSAEEAAGPATMVTDATSAYAGFALIGGQVADLLTRLTTFDPARLQPGVALGMQLLKIPCLVVPGERSVEVYVGSEYGRYAWESMLAIGHPLDVRPVGWEALRAEGILP